MPDTPTAWKLRGLSTGLPQSEGCEKTAEGSSPHIPEALTGEAPELMECRGRELTLSPAPILAASCWPPNDAKLVLLYLALALPHYPPRTLPASLLSSCGNGSPIPLWALSRACPPHHWAFAHAFLLFSTAPPWSHGPEPLQSALLWAVSDCSLLHPPHGTGNPSGLCLAQLPQSPHCAGQCLTLSQRSLSSHCVPCSAFAGIDQSTFKVIFKDVLETASGLGAQARRLVSPVGFEAGSKFTGWVTFMELHKLSQLQFLLVKWNE